MLPHERLTRLRRWTFRGAVAAYAAALPVLLAFAFGIEIAPETTSVTPTGSVSVRTIPEATVTLEGHAAVSTPAVFDGLRAGTYAFRVQSPGRRTWTGRVVVSPSTAYDLDLSLPADEPPRVEALIEADGAPVLVEGGRAAAFVSGDSRSLVLATLLRPTVAVERVSLPEAVQSVIHVSSGRLMLRGRASGRIYGVDVMGTPGLRKVDLPVQGREVLSLSGDGLSALVLEPAGVRRYLVGHEPADVVDFATPLMAYGEVRGSWYFLERSGVLHEVGYLPAPRRLGVLATGSCDECVTPQRILAATPELAWCLDPATGELRVYTREGGAASYGAYDGAQARSGPEGTWLWSANELYLARAVETPRPVAAFEGRVTGVCEDFEPGYLAVDTEGGVYLLPLETERPEVAFDPLLLYRNAEGETTVAARDGALLTRLGSEVRVARVVWAAG